MAYDEQIAQRVRDVLSEECTADEKRMFSGIAFLVNGHMCCGVRKDPSLEEVVLSVQKGACLVSAELISQKELWGNCGED